MGSINKHTPQYVIVVETVSITITFQHHLDAWTQRIPIVQCTAQAIQKSNTYLETTHS